jgi:hypothetical protein
MSFLSECCRRSFRHAGAYLGIATSIIGVLTAFQPSHRAVNVFLFALLVTEVVTLSGVAATVYRSMSTCVESNVVFVSPAYFASHDPRLSAGTASAGLGRGDGVVSQEYDDVDELRVAAAEAAARACFVAVRRLGLEAIAAVGAIVTAIGCCATRVDEAVEAVAVEGGGGAYAAGGVWAEDGPIDMDDGHDDERTALTMPKSAPTCPITPCDC